MQKIVLFVDHYIGYRILKNVGELANNKYLSPIAVITTQDNGKKWWPGVEPLAKSFNIPFFRYNISDLLEFKKLHEADYFFLISWKHLMPKQLFSIPRYGTINLHYSLLPKFRGTYPVNWAIIKGELTTGISYHWVDDTIDGGNIILQRKVEIENIDTAKSLYEKMDKAAYNAFTELITCLEKSPRYIEKPQNIADKNYTYTKDEFMKTNEIDLNSVFCANDFIQLLRGKTFYPEGKNLFFIDSLTKEKIFVSIILEK